VIVVPSSYGGCDEFGWNLEYKPTENRKDVWTRDLFDEASEPFRRKRYVVRVSRGLIFQALLDERRSELESDHVDPQRREQRWDDLRVRAKRIADETETALLNVGLSGSAKEICQELEKVLPDQLQVALRRFQQPKRTRLERPVFPYNVDEDSQPGVIITAPFGVKDHAVSESRGDIRNGLATTEDDEGASFLGKAQLLFDHSNSVRDLASVFAGSAGFESKLVEDLTLAAWLHDSGKADRRFQLLLADGDFAFEEVLAKSARGRSAPGAWERAKLPDYWRHEALSVRLALENPRLQEAHDRALVLWLIGSHHGWGRPFFPHSDPLDVCNRNLPKIDGLVAAELRAGAGPQSLGFVVDGERFGPTERDSNDLRGLDWPTMFRELKERFGPWGLARLEAFLRLADHRASAFWLGTGEEA
jgi:CRISPR-associated endonuclease/helicase Cas3